MRKLSAIAVGACALLALAASQVAQADTPSIQSTWSATDVGACNGSTTVHVHIDAINPPAIQKPIDVAFVIDESGSIAPANFVTVKNSIVGWANGQNFGPSTIGAGVVGFATNAFTEVPFTLARPTFVNGVNAMTQNAGSTDITDGLLQGQAMLVGAGARATAPNVLILETDGFANVNTAGLPSAISLVKGAGTTIFTVGVGTGTDPAELRSIASTPADYFGTDYAALDSAFQQIATELDPAATNLTYSVNAAPGWTITSASPGSTFTASTLSFSRTPVSTGAIDITYTMQHTGTTGGALAPQASALLSWIDPSGAAQSTDYSGETVTVDGCNQPPTANAGPDQQVTLSGSPLSLVALDGSGSTDDGQISPLTYTWSENGSPIATGPSPVVSLGSGPHHITLTVDDGQFQASDDVEVDVADVTPPVITPTISGTLGNAGWYITNIGVSWNVVDLESPASRTGCGPSTVSADTPSVSFTCSATSAGGSNSVSTGTLKRDATNPAVTYAGNAGVYGVNDNVNITCTPSDNLSGVASSTCVNISGPAYTFAASSSFSASATDNAGNVGPGSTSFTVVVRAADICALINTWVSNRGIANALCVKVAHDTQNAFINQVNAQRGKALTSAQADVLIALIREL